MKKYKVTTHTQVVAEGMCQIDDWIFDTREEAQEFVDRFHEAFPKDESSPYGLGIDDDDPYIYTDMLIPEIEEIDYAYPDPYAWLAKMSASKNKNIKKYLQKSKIAV